MPNLAGAVQRKAGFNIYFSLLLWKSSVPALFLLNQKEIIERKRGVRADVFSWHGHMCWAASSVSDFISVAGTTTICELHIDTQTHLFISWPDFIAETFWIGRKAPGRRIKDRKEVFKGKK